MKKYEVIEEKSVPAFVETVLCADKSYEFYRLRVDTQYGSIYFYPKYNSQEQFVLKIVSKH